MKSHAVSKRIETLFSAAGPVGRRLVDYKKTRGLPFIQAWAHRISGLLLVVYIFFHVSTLSLLQSPQAFDDKMKWMGFFIFVILEWALAVPVIFHALNGGRLILYESFGYRNDDRMFRLIMAYGSAYLLLLGAVMIAGDQVVSYLFFWSVALIISIGLAWSAGSKIRTAKSSCFWKFQRISGAFLFVMIPAHLLFMHLNPSIGHDAGIVTARMGNLFVKLIDSVLLILVLYHGGYGVVSILYDYIRSQLLKTCCAAFVSAAMIIIAIIGINLNLNI